MNKNLSIVLSRENPNYRRAAQLWYGLTDEQMKNVDVHHNPSRSKGGRNIPEHLYIYHETLHNAVHGNDFTQWARKGAIAAAKVREKLLQSETYREKLRESGRKSSSKVAQKRTESSEYDKYYRKTRGAGGEACMRQHNAEITEKSMQKLRKAVIFTNIDTGDTRMFLSLNEASRQLGLSQGNISSVLNGQRKRVGRWNVGWAG